MVEYLVLGRNVSPFHEILSSVAVCLEVKLLLSVKKKSSTSHTSGTQSLSIRALKASLTDGIM